MSDQEQFEQQVIRDEQDRRQTEEAEAGRRQQAEIDAGLERVGQGIDELQRENESLRAQLAEQNAVLDAISRALHGDGVSDFEESFPLVRIANDHFAEVNHLRAAHDAAVARVKMLEGALEETMNLASVADDGDSWYAEHEGLDSGAILARAREALGRKGTG